MVKRKGKGGTQGATGQLARIIIRDRLWAAVVDITNPPKNDIKQRRNGQPAL